jgi:hypothetical protein
VLPLILGGCFAMALGGVMSQNFEYQKLIEIPAQYDGLRDKRIAVLVEADLSILYEHPRLTAAVASNVSGAIAANVEGAQVISPKAVLSWQYHTPQWNALPYGAIADALQVDRVVLIDIYEYRLHPPGNRWIWGGAAMGDVGIVEADSLDPDSFVETFQVQAAYPDIEGVGRETATASQIETGLLTRFLRETAWLFYLHERPKYPDKYQGAAP